MCARLTAEDHAVCLELCARIYKESSTVCLHAHVACASQKRRRWTVTSKTEQACLNDKYMLQVDELVGKQRSIGWQTFYYASCPKTKQLWADATKEAHVDYWGQANWFWSHVQPGKISMESARGELVRRGSRLTQHLPNLLRLRSELIAHELKEMIAAKEAIIAAQRRP